MRAPQSDLPILLDNVSYVARGVAILDRVALETSKGDLPLAIGLGLVLIVLVVAVNAAAWGLRRAGERFAG